MKEVGCSMEIHDQVLELFFGGLLHWYQSDWRLLNHTEKYVALMT